MTVPRARRAGRQVCGACHVFITWLKGSRVIEGSITVQGQLNGIPLPDEVLRTPGHYSVVALLPEDHTYAKGSLFILAPGTKCIVFDMDGEVSELAPADVKEMPTRHQSLYHCIVIALYLEVFCSRGPRIRHAALHTSTWAHVLVQSQGLGLACHFLSKNNSDTFQHLQPTSGTASSNFSAKVVEGEGSAFRDRH